MGAPKRRRIVSAAPRPYWYAWDESSTNSQPPIPALLVEWSQVETRIGTRWEGLIVDARRVAGRDAVGAGGESAPSCSV